MRKLGEKFPIVAICLLLVACVTTQQTLPDGTVIRTTKADAEQLSAAINICTLIWNKYESYQLEKDKLATQERAEKRAELAQLYGLLQTYLSQGKADLLIPVPEPVAKGTLE